MTTLPIDPELAAAFEKAAQLTAAMGPAGEGVEGARALAAAGRTWWNEGGPIMAERRDDGIPGLYRDIPVVLYRPTADDGLPIFVYLPGGGYRIGNAGWNDRQMREIAVAWGGAVVSIDYAHVPEHVFPRAVEEAQAVLQWLHEQGAAWGLDGDRIAFGGSSAGANVALGAAIDLGGRATGYLRAGVTIAGLLDHDPDTPSMRDFADGPAPSRHAVASLLQDYLPDPAARRDARANPGLADAALFPPMFLAAAELDSLRDSSANLAARLAAAGIDHQLRIYPGMTHTFFGFSRTVAGAQTCVADIAQFLRQQLPA